MYFNELGLEQYVDYVYYYDFDYDEEDDDDDNDDGEKKRPNKNKGNKKRNKFKLNPNLFRKNGTRPHRPGRPIKKRPHHHGHGQAHGHQHGQAHGNGQTGQGHNHAHENDQVTDEASKSPSASSSSVTPSFPLAASVSHTHYSDSFDLEAFKKKMKDLGNNTFVRAKREVIDHPLVFGILDMRVPPGFRVRTGAFTPITLGTFTILSTGTAGKKTISDGRLSWTFMHIDLRVSSLLCRSSIPRISVGITGNYHYHSDDI